MSSIFLAIAAIFDGLSVASGAFASHALSQRLTEDALSNFGGSLQNPRVESTRNF